MIALPPDARDGDESGFLVAIARLEGLLLDEAPQEAVELVQVLAATIRALSILFERPGKPRIQHS